MRAVTEVFNTREIAVGIWACIVFGYAFLQAKDKRYLYLFLRTLLSPKLLILFAVFGLYIAASVALLYKLNMWSWADLKDSIFWAVSVAFVMLLKPGRLREDNGYFRKAAFDTLKITAIIEFIAGVYVGALWFELLLVPVLFLLTILAFASGRDPSTRSAKKVFDIGLAIVGFGLLGYWIYSIASDFQGFATAEHLRSFALTPLLTVAILPVLYVFALYLEYGKLYMHLKFQVRNSSLVWYAMRQILLKYHIRLWALVRWLRQVRTLKVSTKDDVTELLLDEKSNSSISRANQLA